MRVQTARGELLVLLGAFPVDANYVASSHSLIANAAAGFYDPRSNTLFLIRNHSPEEARSTLVHELLHALQDQQTELGRFFVYAARESDRQAAVLSFAEGDAVYFSQRLLGPEENVSSSELRAQLMASISPSPIDQTSPLLRNSLIANYVDGYRFVRALVRRGGVAAVNMAWKRLPRTTEQLLHVDKYLRDEAPMPLKPPVSLALPSDFSLIVDDVLGEQSLRLLLEQWLPSTEAVQAAAGWGADSARVFGRVVAGGKEYAGAMAFRFDRPLDAKEFVAGLRRRWPSDCLQRKHQGPVAYRRWKDRVWIVLGPLRVDSKHRRQQAAYASCDRSRRWLRGLEALSRGYEDQSGGEKE